MSVMVARLDPGHYKTLGGLQGTGEWRLFVPTNPNIDITAQYSDEIKSP